MVRVPYNTKNTVPLSTKIYICTEKFRLTAGELYPELAKWVAMAAGAARLQAAQCRSLCYDKHHRWMVTVVMTLPIYSRVS